MECWDREEKLLAGLTEQHKAIGGPTEQQKKRNKADALNKKKKKAVQRRKKQVEKNKKQGVEKKVQLGGHHGPLEEVGSLEPLQEVGSLLEPVVSAKKRPVWKVGQAVNCKYEEDNKVYGAFITAINTDGTYEVYFPEGAKECHNVPAAHIKKPIMGGKTSAPLQDYVGKQFFDAGTTEAEAKKSQKSGGNLEYFEAGEFVVKSLASNNNFNCLRVDDIDIEDNYVPFDIGYSIERIREYEEE